MELRLHPKDCCKPIASLLLRVIFYALLLRVSVILNTVRSTGEVVRRNQFCESPYKCNSVLKVETNQLFSFVTETLHRKAQQIKDAVIQAKRVDLWLGSQTAWPTIFWLKLMSSMKTIQAKKSKKQIKFVDNLYTNTFNEKEKLLRQSSYNLFF